MARIRPQYTEQQRKETKSFQKLWPKLNSEQWILRGADERDHGVDYSFEYTDDGTFHGYRTLWQVKGRSNIDKLQRKRSFLDKEKEYVSSSLPIKTINYALGCAEPFLLCVVDLNTDKAFYICLQDYFIEHPNQMELLNTDNSNAQEPQLTIYIPWDNQIVDWNELETIAKSTYSDRTGQLVRIAANEKHELAQV